VIEGLEWLLPAGGVVFAALLAAAAIVGDADTDAYLLGLSSVFLVAFLGALRAALRASEGETAPLPATAVIAGSVVATAYLLLATAYAAGPVRVTEFAFFASFPQAIVVGAAGTVMAGRGIISSELGFTGQVLVPLQLGMALVLLSTSDDVAIVLALGPFAAWVAAVGVLLLRPPVPAALPASPDGNGRRP
jgi:hypothetical protein